jgi:4-alpha-glucanotransferase
VEELEDGTGEARVRIPHKDKATSAARLSEKNSIVMTGEALGMLR